MSEPEYISSTEKLDEWTNTFKRAHPKEISAEEAKNILSTLAGEDLSDAMLEELRDMSVGKMQSSLPGKEERILWGEVAILCIHRKNTGEGTNPLASAAEEARVRAYIIREFGEVNCEALWSLAGLCEFIVESIPCSLEDARAKVSHWRSLSREEILLLRRVKNLLNAAESVKELFRGKDEACEALKAWLKIRPQLP